MRVEPTERQEPPVSRLGALSRAELIELVELIMRGVGTEAEQDHRVTVFDQSVPHPAASGLIFWPKDGIELSADEVVDQALAYRAIEL